MLILMFEFTFITYLKGIAMIIIVKYEAKYSLISERDRCDKHIKILRKNVWRCSEETITPYPWLILKKKKKKKKKKKNTTRVKK